MERDTRCFYEEEEIHFYDCDFTEHTRIQAILRIMADVSGIDYATSRGHSHQQMKKQGLEFLITKASVRIHRMPACNETVTLETWEKGIKGAEFLRDINFYDPFGNLLVEGQTAWVLVDPKEHSIQRPSAFSDQFQPVPGKSAQTLPLCRLRPSGEYRLAGERKIVYSDIDGNNHTYNAVYVGIACDFLPVELWRRQLVDFRIEFKREALFGSVLTIQTKVEQNYAAVVGLLGEQTSFITEFWFVDKT